MSLVDLQNRCLRFHTRAEQIKKIRALYDKFQKEFAQHLESYDEIGCKIEETGLELNNLAKQQGESDQQFLSYSVGVFK